MTDDIGCKSIMFRGSATGRVVTCGVCDWCRARRVTELEAEVERLQAEVVWTHERLQLLQEHEDSHWTDPETGEARYLIRDSDYDALIARVTELEAALREAFRHMGSMQGSTHSRAGEAIKAARAVLRLALASPAALAPDTDTTEGGE